MKHLRVLIFLFTLIFVLVGCQDVAQIKFETNGGVAIKAIDIKDIENLEMPTPERVGYTFDGWFYDEDLTDFFDKEILNEKVSITLYAKWIVNDYTLSFNVHGGEELDDMDVPFDQILSLPEPEKQGYTFSGWYLDSSYNTLFEEEKMVDEDLTLHAKWVLTNYTVSFVTYSDDVIHDMSITINDDLDDIIPENEDKTFIGWYLDEALTIPFDFDDVHTESFTLYARWQMSYEEIYDKVMQADNYTLKLADEGELGAEYILKIDGSKISSEIFMYKDYLYYDEEKDMIYQLTPSESQVGCYEKNVVSLDMEFEELLELYTIYRNLLPETFDMTYVANDGIMFVPEAYLEMLNETVFFNELGVNADMFGLSFNDEGITYILIAESINLYLTINFSLIDETVVELPLESICEDLTYVQGVTDSMIYIGNTVPSSGPMAGVGVPFLEGMNAYIQYINSTGGINGRYIELINYDDGFDGTQGLFYTKKLIEENEVFAIVGHFGSATINATLEYLNEVGIPTVYLASSLYGMNINLNDNIFPVQPTSSEGTQLVRRIRNESFFGDNFDQSWTSNKKIGILYDQNTYDVVQKIKLEGLVYNTQVVDRQISSDSQDIESAVQDLKTANVNVVIILSQTNARYAIEEIEQESLHVPVILGYQSVSPVSVNPAISYHFPIFGHQYLDLTTDKGVVDYTKFAYVLENYGDINYVNNAFTIAGYQAMDIFVQGLSQMGTTPLTWGLYIRSLSETYLSLPMGGHFDYLSQTRTGVNAFGLVRYNPSNQMFEPYRDIEEF